MVLEIVKFGNPVLREKGARIEAITPEITRLIEDMFETMRAARGVGLAAQQIGKALQLTVIDVSGITDRPSTLELKGKPADVVAFMPIVLINPEIKPFGNASVGPEGCLSFPELYSDISRPESVEVKALNAKGEPIEFSCGGLLSRAVQHEVDHLNAILFIDRMDKEEKAALRPDLDALQKETKAALTKK
ncbi:MAG: peptide deformylase [Verrucomicrobiales bacterium]|nr:peptide deformylase [Verrucomicrobiales bacterium]